MDSDEREIINYLRAWPKQFVAAKEICRRASGKRRFMREPDWAYPALNRLVEKGIIETDSTGHYRFLSVDKKEKKKKWVSPQIKKILDQSGKDFNEVIGIDEDMD
jgi:Fe2+ or Zn2+ uptake regulation protein